MYVKTALGTGETLQVKIVGVIENTGMFAQVGNLLLISPHDCLASAPATLANYSQVNITTVDQAHTNTAVNAINNQFSLVSTQTATDILKGEQTSIGMVSTFLKIAGLLALLSGDIGIINTMQVLLSRRKTEIAMLKTAGYHRKDLFVLFGIEAGLLGLIGGIIGAAASIGVSYLIRNLMEQFDSNVPFVLNTGMIIGGVVIGFLTALIFGMLPIVQAANIRPLSVLREIDNRRELGILKSVGYTSKTILSQVMIENGIAGGIGAFIATLLAAGGVTLGSKIFFNNSLTLNMEPTVIVSMVIDPALLAILVAVLVAWNAVRVRPLEVLRYE